MQLLVIPVTSRFLRQPSRARDVEFGFATKQCRIPVLPLTQEPGLEAEFNQKCGNLQILGRDSQEMGRLDEAREYHLGEIELFTWLCTQSWSPWSKPADAWWHWRWLYGICRDLGNDSLKTGRLEEALDYYQRSMEASQRAYRISATKESTEEYFTACVQMVQSLTQPGGLRRAGEYVEKAFEACEKRPADMSGDQSMWKDLISAFENLRRNGVIPMAETKDQGLKELGLRFTKEVSPKEKQELAGRCEQLGAVSRAQGDLNRAKACYLYSLELFQQLYRKTSGEQQARSLAGVYEKLGDMALEEGKPLTSKFYYLQCFEYFQNLYNSQQARLLFPEDYEVFSDLAGVEAGNGLSPAPPPQPEPEPEPAERGLAVCRGKLGDLCRGEYKREFQKQRLLRDENQAWKQLEAAEEHYQEASDLFRQLWEETKDLEALKNLAVCYEKLGDIVRDQVKLFDFEYWDPYGTEHYYQEAVNLFEQVWEAAKTP